MRVRASALVLGGVLLAALSLGLPWGAYAGLPGYLTLGYYTTGYCDLSYCYGGTYVPGYYVPGYDGGVIPGTASTARFFIVGAVALALIGWRLGRARWMRASALVALVGIGWHVGAGLTGGVLALGFAAGCWWLAGRSGSSVGTLSG